MVLRAAGLRVTPQRQLLVEVARTMPGHFTAKAVHDRIVESFPGVSLVSVYRGLESLVELGLVTRTDLGSDLDQYEWAAGRGHHHLVCLACRQQIELPDKEMDDLRARLWERYGFAARIDHHAFFGLCRVCQAQREAEETSS
jgi:Fe2+ or Zn2+ uptake regulation protein